MTKHVFAIPTLFSMYRHGCFTHNYTCQISRAGMLNSEFRINYSYKCSNANFLLSDYGWIFPSKSVMNSLSVVETIPRYDPQIIAGNLVFEVPIKEYLRIKTVLELLGAVEENVSLENKQITYWTLENFVRKDILSNLQKAVNPNVKVTSYSVKDIIDNITKSKQYA